MYGPFCTKMQMEHTPGCYWKEAPVPVLFQDATNFLDDQSLDSHSHLHLLHTRSVGGNLVVTNLFETSGLVMGAFIMILAAPSVVTYCQEITDQGLILDDLWDDSTLQGFDPALVMSMAHCPILATQEVYSHDHSPPTKVETSSSSILNPFFYLKVN
jgi:hypothetical protein